MPRVRKDTINNHDRLPPVSTPEARENQAISLAYSLAEQQLRDGTASSQTINFFLKMGSPQTTLEREILAEQKKLVEAKTKAIKSSEEIKELFQEATAALKVYQGVDDTRED